MKNTIPFIINDIRRIWLLPSFDNIAPGSGTAIMSKISGFIVSIEIVIKTYWYKLIYLFNGESKNTSSETEEG